MPKKQQSVLEFWSKKRRIRDVESERDGNSEVNTAVGNEPSSPPHENVPFGTEPRTSAQQISANAEVMKAGINIDIELDIVNFLDRRGLLSDETKYNLLKKPFKPNSNYPFPVQVIGTKTRKFQISWMDKYVWLVFFGSKKRMFL